MLYLEGDILLFLLIKMIRGDFRYWLNLPPSLSLPLSLVARILAKVLTDITLVIHTRHPFDVGGLQFCWLIVQNQLACFVAGWYYLKYYDGAYDKYGEEAGGDRKIKDTMLWAGLVGLLGLFLVSCVAFISLIDWKYLHTFFGWTTGRAVPFLQD